jgi:hypothetical protein
MKEQYRIDYRKFEGFKAQIAKLEPGAKVSATFTVKAHEVYKDTLQTKITRAKI